MRTRVLQIITILAIFSTTFIFQKAYSQGQVDIKSYLRVTNGLANFPNVLNSGDLFGCSVTNAGDLDGDGIPDIVVGAYGTVVSTGTTGAIYIIYMNADGTAKYVPSQHSYFVEDLAPTGANFFGVSVANIGDIDGDGIPDLAVGASADPSGTSGVTFSGDVFICFMKSDGTYKSAPVKIAGSSLKNWSNQAVSGPQFGKSVACIGDLDGDGINDIIVGAQADKCGTTAPSGSVFVIFLKSTGAVKSSQKIDYGLNGNFSGYLGSADQFGSSVAGIGDFDGDGIPDVAVGAPNTNDVKNLSGAMYILNLNSNGTVKTGGVTKISNNTTAFKKALSVGTNFGASIAYLKDFRYKGIRAFAVGAPGDSDYYAPPKNRAKGTGAVWVIYLDSATNNLLYFNKISAVNTALQNQTFYVEAGDNFGASVIDYASSKGDTTEKLIIGVPIDSGENPLPKTGGFYEINFGKYEMKADSIIFPPDTVCAKSPQKIGILFENRSNSPVDSIPFTVKVTGPVALTIQDTFYRTAPVSSQAVPITDTFYFNTNLPSSKPGTYTMKAYISYPGDFDHDDDTVTRTVYVLPALTQPNFGTQKTVYKCVGDSVKLDLENAGARYDWYQNNIQLPVSSEVYYLKTQGNYIGIASIGGCTISDTIQAYYLKSATVKLGPDQTICFGDSTTLNSGYPDAQHGWYTTFDPFNNLDTTNSFTIKNNKSDTYFATVTYASHGTACEYTDTINITYNHVIVNLGRDTVLCEGQKYVLNAQNPGSSYIWYKDGVVQVDTFSTDTITQNGKYAVTVKNGSCFGSDTAVVSFVSVPSFSLAPKFDTLCSGQTRVLNAGNAGYTHHWYRNASLIDTATQITANTDGIYAATVLNPNNKKCFATDTTNIKYNVLTVSLGTGAAINLCEGVTQQLFANVSTTVNNTKTYQWFENGIPVGTNKATYTVDSAGKYWVVVTVGHCTASDSVTVTYTHIATPKFGPADTFMCRGNSMTLDALNPGATYNWTTPHGTFSTETVTADTTGTYSVKVDDNKCEVVAAITLTYLNINVNLGHDTTLCVGRSLTLDAKNNQYNATYQWYLDGNALPGVTAQRYSPQQTGSYMVMVYQKQCSDSGKVNVTFLPSPVTVHVDTTICYNDSIVLDAGNPGAKYLWVPTYKTTETIQIARTLSPTPVRKYLCYITNGACTDTSVYNIFFYDQMTVNIPTSAYLCDSFSAGARLDAGAGFASYDWEPIGSKTEKVIITAPGSYTITVKNAGGCSLTDTTNVYDCPPNDVYIPSAFSPDGDDVNDSFKIYNLNSVQYQLTIYNRWGEQVFQSNDPNKAWDGKMDGNNVMEGIYAWTVIYRLKTSTGTPPQRIISGTVMLVRH